MKRPWEFLAEIVWPDLLSSFEFVRKEMKCQKYEEVKPILVARFGKILYNGYVVHFARFTVLAILLTI